MVDERFGPCRCMNSFGPRPKIMIHPTFWEQGCATSPTSCARPVFTSQHVHRRRSIQVRLTQSIQKQAHIIGRCRWHGALSFYLVRRLLLSPDPFSPLLRAGTLEQQRMRT
jgi:hypothetical protein